MGTYSKSNFGKISGKVGEAVGSKWRNIKYLRSLPTKSSKKATESQLAVHARFALSAAQLSPIKDILYLGFGDKKLSKITGYNAAVRAFIANTILGEYPDYTVDYAKLQLSKGDMPPLKHLNMVLDAGILTLNWVYTKKRKAFPDDTVIVVVYNKTSNLYEVEDSFVRSDGTLTVDPDADPDDVLHVWAFCITRDGAKVSPTQYVGTVTV